MAEKARSRNYPAFGLPEAIAKAKQLYERDGKASVNAEVAVQAWGYKGLNGASLRALGGVRQYGLLDLTGTKVVKVSPRALTIILEPEDSEERNAAIIEAAMQPAMFREMREQYPDSLPSDAAMVSWLVRNHNFSETAAKDLIASFRDTLALVEKLPTPNIPPEGGRRSPEPKASAKPVSATDIFGGLFEKPAPAPSGGRMEFQWPLSNNAIASLVVSSKTQTIDLEDVETLAAYLEIAKRTLTKAAKDGAAAADGMQA